MPPLVLKSQRFFFSILHHFKGYHYNTKQTYFSQTFDFGEIYTEKYCNLNILGVPTYSYMHLGNTYFIYLILYWPMYNYYLYLCNEKERKCRNVIRRLKIHHTKHLLTVVVLWNQARSVLCTKWPMFSKLCYLQCKKGQQTLALRAPLQHWLKL